MKLKCPYCNGDLILMDRKKDPPQSYVCDCGYVMYI